MSVPLTIQGVTFQYPQQGDNNWGPTLTNWSTAVTNALKALPVAGTLQLSPFAAAVINFANATDTGFLPLAINGSNQLTFNGTPLATSGGGTVNVGTQYQLGYYATSSNAMSGLTLITPNRALESDSNGLPVASAVTSTTLAFLDATSSIQTQINAAVVVANNALPESGGTMSGNIAMGSNKITGLANGTNPADAVNFSQIPTNLPPTGSIIMYGAGSAPTGWLLCDGTSYTTASEPNLFAIIGYTFGGGGSNFNVPNMTNNVPIGAGSIAALGASAGSQTHTLTASEIPVAIGTANSVVTDPGHVHVERVNLAGSGSGVGISPTGPATTFENTNINTTSALTGITVATTITNAGGGNAISLVQPVLGLTFIIKT